MLWSPCGCGGVNCSYCTGGKASSAWLLTIPNSITIAHPGGYACIVDNYNGTFHLAYNGEGPIYCSWSSCETALIASTCTGHPDYSEPRFMMIVDGTVGRVGALSWYDAGYAYLPYFPVAWQLALASFDCTGSNTLPVVSYDPTYTFPSATITPATTSVDCPNDVRGCLPAINYADLTASFAFPDLTFPVCLTRVGVNQWYGAAQIDYPGCGLTSVVVLLYCDKASGDWKLDITANGTTETFTVTVDDPFTAATASGTSTNVCGSKAFAASIVACASPPTYPCCTLGDTFSACCTPIPDLQLNQTWDFGDGSDCASGGGTLTAAGTLTYNSGTGKWAGAITWIISGCCSSFAHVTQHVEVDCGYTLTDTDTSTLLSTSSTAPCPITTGLSFPGVTTPILCDAISRTVTLDFTAVFS